MSAAFERIAFERISRAAAAGEFDRLPGAGRVLDLGLELLVPAEPRKADRVLRNAACVRPELATLKLAREALSRPASAPEDQARRVPRRRLAALHDTLGSAGRLPRTLWAADGPQLLARFAGRR